MAIVIAYTTLFTTFLLRLFNRYYGHMVDDSPGSQQTSSKLVGSSRSNPLK